MQATDVPIAVPSFCRNQQSSSWKTLLFMTMSRRSSTSCLLKSSGSSSWCMSNHFLMMSMPCILLMLVCMKVASAVMSLAFFGSFPSCLTSFMTWFESLVKLGHRWMTHWSWTSSHFDVISGKLSTQLTTGLIFRGVLWTLCSMWHCGGRRTFSWDPRSFHWNNPGLL